MNRSSDPARAPRQSHRRRPTSSPNRSDNSHRSPERSLRLRPDQSGVELRTPTAPAHPAPPECAPAACGWARPRPDTLPRDEKSRFQCFSRLRRRFLDLLEQKPVGARDQLTGEIARHGQRLRARQAAAQPPGPRRHPGCEHTQQARTSGTISQTRDARIDGVSTKDSLSRRLRISQFRISMLPAAGRSDRLHDLLEHRFRRPQASSGRSASGVSIIVWMVTKSRRLAST